MTMNEKKTTVRLCVTVVSLMAIGLLFAVGMVAVDTVSGRLLHGNDYRTEIRVETAWPYLPMRWQVLWEILGGSSR